MLIRRGCRGLSDQGVLLSLFSVLAVRGRRNLVYLATFLAVSLIAGVSYRAVVWGSAVMACRHLDAPGTLLAYCSSPAFAYYEHGAYFYDLEPAAVENLKKADVIFLGSSHEQIGFST